MNQNPVLKKAGVVDAGGMGFVMILQGMLDELHGIPAPADDQEPSPVPQREKADFGGFETGEIQFGYCTEFICSRDTQKDPEALRAFLNGLGDSLVLVDDDEIIKVHVHTNHPGKVLEEAPHLRRPSDGQGGEHAPAAYGTAPAGGRDRPPAEPAPGKEIRFCGGGRRGGPGKGLF